MPQDAEPMKHQVTTQIDPGTVVTVQTAASQAKDAPVDAPRRRRSLNMAAHKIEYFRYR
jgi:hypothetical protein